MRVVGVRAWAAKLAYVVLDGEPGAPNTVDRWHGPLIGVGAQRLLWARDEVVGLVRRQQPDVIGFRGIETMARNPDSARVEVEAAVQLGALDAEVQVERHVWSTMAHPLGVSEGGAMAAFLRSDPFIASFHSDEREAAAVALCLLRKHGLC